MTVSPIEKYRARVDELLSLKAELEAASRPGDPAPVVGRILEAAGDLLRRRLKVPCDEALIDGALQAIPERGLHSWVDGVRADEVRSRLERAADQAVEAAIPDSADDEQTLTSWAVQTLLTRDRLESAKVAVERLATQGRAGAGVALGKVKGELTAADEQARRCTNRLTALNADRRDELAILDVERRASAWWLSDKAGLEHDLVVKVLGGEGKGSLSSAEQQAHSLVMEKRPRRYSFDELFRFDLGLASPAEREALVRQAVDDPELKQVLAALDEGDRAIDEVTKDDAITLRAAEVRAAVDPRGPAPEVIEERTEFKLLVFRTKQRVQVVVQPRRQDRFATAAVYLPDNPQRGVPSEVGEHGLHFDVGAPERVEGLVAKVVVQLVDGRNVTTEFKL